MEKKVFILALVIVSILIFSFINKGKVNVQREVMEKAEEKPKRIIILPPNEVNLYADRFEPNKINVKEGAVIKIFNKDNVDHILTIKGLDIEIVIPANSFVEYPDTFGKKTIEFIDKDGKFTLLVEII